MEEIEKSKRIHIYLRGSSIHARKCRDKHVYSGDKGRDNKLGNHYCVHYSNCKRPLPCNNVAQTLGTVAITKKLPRACER